MILSELVFCYKLPLLYGVAFYNEYLLYNIFLIYDILNMRLLC